MHDYYHYFILINPRILVLKKGKKISCMLIYCTCVDMDVCERAWL